MVVWSRSSGAGCGVVAMDDGSGTDEGGRKTERANAGYKYGARQLQGGATQLDIFRRVLNQRSTVEGAVVWPGSPTCENRRKLLPGNNLQDVHSPHCDSRVEALDNVLPHGSAVLEMRGEFGEARDGSDTDSAAGHKPPCERTTFGRICVNLGRTFCVLGRGFWGKNLF